MKPSQSRWETGWDELVDEMQELSHKAIADVLKTQSTWILPLSSGLDSRLIAGVAADVGTNVYTYAYGASDMTDVVYSKANCKKRWVSHGNILNCQRISWLNTLGAGQIGWKQPALPRHVPDGISGCFSR